MPFQVVLDTCVLVPLPLRDTLLTLAADDLYVPRWAGRSLASMEAVLVARRGIDAGRARRVSERMAAAFESAEIAQERFDPLIPAMTNHTDDRYVLAAAVAVNAAKIVTLNVRHFPLDACERHGVEAITPDEFLLDLLSLYPSRVVDGLTVQAGRLTSPKLSAADVVDRLEAVVPRFAAQVRARLPVG